MRLLKNLLLITLVAMLLAGHGGLSATNTMALNRGLEQFRSALAGQETYQAQATAGELGSQADRVISQIPPWVVSIIGVKKVAAAPSGQPETARKLSMPGFDLYYTVPSFSDFAPARKISAGTGFFISSDGYILTNKHVVTDDQAEYTVVLKDGKEKKGSVAYRDPENDIAVVKIEGENYPALSLGDSSKLKVGQPVISVGNSYNSLQSKVSVGEVSALKRSALASSEEDTQILKNLIQSSVWLYPGDSGGPLLNMDGEVIGINTATVINKNNISFSIPINDGKKAALSKVGLGK
jgi:S1-C subfamily serine protease